MSHQTVTERIKESEGILSHCILTIQLAIWLSTMIQERTQTSSFFFWREIFEMFQI